MTNSLRNTNKMVLFLENVIFAAKFRVSERKQKIFKVGKIVNLLQSFFSKKENFFLLKVISNKVGGRKICPCWPAFGYTHFSYCTFYLILPLCNTKLNLVFKTDCVLNKFKLEIIMVVHLTT